MLTRRSFLKITGASTIAWYVAARRRMDAAGHRPDSGRHARPDRRPEVRDAAADPAGDAAGGDDHHAGRQAGRLLRDLDAAALPADPAGRACRRRPSGATAPSRSASSRGLLLHHAPSLTIEATWKRPVRIKWINDLVDTDGNYLPHLLPVDPTLHWANPPGGATGRDTRPTFDCHARPLHRPGADRDPPARRRRGRRRERRLRRGLVPARAPTTSPPATPPRAPGTTSSRARRARSSASPGGRGTRPSSTRTTSASRPSGTTTTRWA